MCFFVVVDTSLNTLLKQIFNNNGRVRMCFFVVGDTSLNTLLKQIFNNNGRGNTLLKRAFFCTTLKQFFNNSGTNKKNRVDNF
jgi:hypothetical protein